MSINGNEHSMVARTVPTPASAALLLLATASLFFLALARNDLAQHHHTIAVHECHTRQTLAILECVANQWLLWCKTALGHLVRFQGVRVLHFLAAGLFPHLPLELPH